MARRFTKTAFPNNQYAEFAFLPSSTTKISFAYYYKAATLPETDSPDRHAILSRGAGVQEYNYQIIHREDDLTFVWTSATSVYHAQFGAYTWDLNEHLVCIAMDWDNDAISMWVDGVPLSVSSSGLNTTPQTASQNSRFLGILSDSTDNLDATIAEFAIWTNYALTQEDVDQYNNRISPDQIRPQNLAHYWEMSGFNHLSGVSVFRELEPINGTWMELHGGVGLDAAVVDHPRFYHAGGFDEALDDSGSGPSGSDVLVDKVWRNLEYRYFADPVAPELIDPRVMILDAATLLPIIEIESYTDLHYVKSWTDLDRFDLKIGAQTFDGQRLQALGIVPSGYDFILQVLINNVFDFAGIIEFTAIEIADGKDVYVLKGGGVDKMLQNRLAIPPAGLETDSYNDIAENVMRALVDVNLINPQATDVVGLNQGQRTVDLLDQTPNLSIGATVQVEARNQTVFEAVREAALQDGELGFQILIVGGQYLFDVLEGTDRSAYVVFALDRDNLKNLIISYDKSNYVNWLIMGGAGEGATRALAAAFAVTADQSIKRKERFQDARELTTAALLQERGRAILATEGEFVSISGERMPVSYPQYKIDFELGDLITFSAPEYELSVVKRVVEVEVTLTQGHPLEVRMALGKAKVRTNNMVLRNSLQATSRA